MTESKDSEGKRGLEDVLLWICLAVVVAAVVAATIYYLYFGSHLALPLSGDPETWGQFGDYIGGLLNPSIALCALMLLARGVLLQRDTLKAAKDEMRGMASIAQRQRFDSQFAALISMLAEHMRQHGTRLKAHSTSIRSSFVRGDRNAARVGFENISGEMQVLMSLVRALTASIEDQGMNEAEAERYLEIIRSSIGANAGVLLLIGPVIRTLPESDSELVRKYRLVHYGPTREISEINAAMSKMATS